MCRERREDSAAGSHGVESVNGLCESPGLTELVAVQQRQERGSEFWSLLLSYSACSGQQQSLTSDVACETAFHAASAEGSGVNGCGRLASAAFGVSITADWTWCNSVIEE